MMNQKDFPLQEVSRRSLVMGLAAVAAAGVSSSCTDAKTAAESRVYQMGEKVDVGNVVYTVLEADWRAGIGEGANPMVPKDRFLVIRLAITNGTGAQISLPFLSIENRKKEPFMEVQEVRDLSQWMGLVRLIGPAQTEDGRIVFDVPQTDYFLRVTNSDPENEITRLVEIKLTLPDASTIAK